LDHPSALNFLGFSTQKARNFDWHQSSSVEAFAASFIPNHADYRFVFTSSFGASEFDIARRKFVAGLRASAVHT
jgi:hypothetical protein